MHIQGLRILRTTRKYEIRRQRNPELMGGSVGTFEEEEVTEVLQYADCLGNWEDVGIFDVEVDER